MERLHNAIDSLVVHLAATLGKVGLRHQYRIASATTYTVTDSVTALLHRNMLVYGVIDALVHVNTAHHYTGRATTRWRTPPPSIHHINECNMHYPNCSGGTLSPVHWQPSGCGSIQLHERPHNTRVCGTPSLYVFQSPG